MSKPYAFDLWTAGNVLELELNEPEVIRLAQSLSKFVEPGWWLILEGDLGAGKTTFVKHFARALGFTQLTSSPTFPILNVIDIKEPITAVRRVCHLDLYRLKNAVELKNLGLELEFSSSAICVLEWSELIDSDGWNDFFTTTRCRMPKKIAQISITNSSSEGVRQYRFSWQSLEQFAGL
ncbi:tRNA (adenosine(37)-N6)-threonylcarbamoyltransferase complex ATPase subunit type 1 TsaE [bacterium]|nr:tRNA (adenosine(37)-N6)-threonylcarbamoyltransferase complex ATPase subunit type 1 TsaE [bacterium]